MERFCDHKSIGVILTNEHDELALLERRRFPVGIAPPAGHIDQHGGLEQAAVAEVLEEIGVPIAINGLKRLIDNRRIANTCRRIDGNYHDWTIYQAYTPSVQLLPSPDETRGASWYDRPSIANLARRTRLYQAGLISPDDWEQYPGLEPVWLDFLTELGYVKEHLADKP